MQGAGVGVFTPPPHEDNTQDIPSIDPGGRRWQGGSRDIRGVLPAGTEVSSINRRQIPGKGEQSRESHRTLMYQHWKAKVEIIK